mmetsp:Transcript_117231/g.336319  ORF Transcript_117231/g.336319 Transcript_117231/m.336319 type:complete len:215 (+) Transcript_117231:2-646(+)
MRRRSQRPGSGPRWRSAHVKPSRNPRARRRWRICGPGFQPSRSRLPCSRSTSRNEGSKHCRRRRSSSTTMKTCCTCAGRIHSTSMNSTSAGACCRKQSCSRNSSSNNSNNNLTPRKPCPRTAFAPFSRRWSGNTRSNRCRQLRKYQSTGRPSKAWARRRRAPPAVRRVAMPYTCPLQLNHPQPPSGARQSRDRHWSVRPCQPHPYRAGRHRSSR